MLAAALAPNLDQAPTPLQEEGAVDGMVGAIMGGGSGRGAIEHMIHKNLPSAGLAALPGQAAQPASQSASACGVRLRASASAVTRPALSRRSVPGSTISTAGTPASRSLMP